MTERQYSLSEPAWFACHLFEESQVRVREAQYARIVPSPITPTLIREWGEVPPVSGPLTLSGAHEAFLPASLLPYLQHCGSILGSNPERPWRVSSQTIDGYYSPPPGSLVVLETEDEVLSDKNLMKRLQDTASMIGAHPHWLVRGIPQDIWAQAPDESRAFLWCGEDYIFWPLSPYSLSVMVAFTPCGIRRECDEWTENMVMEFARFYNWLRNRRYTTGKLLP